MLYIKNILIFNFINIYITHIKILFNKLIIHLQYIEYDLNLYNTKHYLKRFKNKLKLTIKASIYF